MLFNCGCGVADAGSGVKSGIVTAPGKRAVWQACREPEYYKTKVQRMLREAAPWCC